MLPSLILPTYYADQGLALAVLHRSLGWDGEPVVRADVASITRAIWLPGDTPLQQGDDDSLVIADVLFDAWQTNSELWPFSDSGYNFMDIIPGSLLSTVATRQIQYTFTPTSGEAFGFEITLKVRRRYA